MGARVDLAAAFADIGRAAAAAGKQLRGMGLELPAAPQRLPAVPVYVVGRANRCPDCHSEAFAVGRVTAECAGCGLPMALVASRRVM